MTILHSIATARAATTGPAAARWPAGARHTIDDIVIGGASLAAAARAQTPLVRIGEAPVLDGQAHRQEFVTILVTRVEHVDHLGILQRCDVWVDAALQACAPLPAEARIIGRPATARTRRVRVLSESDPGHHLDVRLPADLRDGDLVAIPCRGTLPLSSFAPRDAPHAAAPVAPPEIAAPEIAAPDDGDFYGVCGK